MNAVGWLVSPLASALGLFKKPKAAAAPLPTAQPDDARAEADRADALRRRRGGAADMVTGLGGTEAGAGATGKTTLGS